MLSYNFGTWLTTLYEAVTRVPAMQLHQKRPRERHTDSSAKPATKMPYGLVCQSPNAVSSPRRLLIGCTSCASPAACNEKHASSPLLHAGLRPDLGKSLAIGATCPTEVPINRGITALGGDSGELASIYKPKALSIQSLQPII